MATHLFQAKTKDHVTGEGWYYHCTCGEYYTKDFEAFKQHCITGEIPTGRGEFKVIELFPPRNGHTTSDCTECGAYVKIQQQVRHTQWHNKVADL